MYRHMADVGTFPFTRRVFPEPNPVYMAVLDLCLFRHLYGDMLKLRNGHTAYLLSDMFP